MLVFGAYGTPFEARPPSAPIWRRTERARPALPASRRQTGTIASIPWSRMSACGGDGCEKPDEQEERDRVMRSHAAQGEGPDLRAARHACTLWRNRADGQRAGTRAERGFTFGRPVNTLAA